jgi:hypothetical protein
MTLSEYKNKANTSPANKNNYKLFVTNIDKNKDFQLNLNNNNIIKKLNQNFINTLEDNNIIQNKESILNNNIMINDEPQKITNRKNGPKLSHP